MVALMTSSRFFADASPLQDRLHGPVLATVTPDQLGGTPVGYAAGGRENLYRLLTENASEAIVMANLRGERRYHSPAIKRILGYDENEAKAVRLRDHVHPDDINILKAATSGLSRTNPTGFARYRARHKAGHYIWIEASYRYFLLPSDEPVIVTALRNVDERVSIEMAHQRLFEQATVGMFRLNLSGYPLCVNHTFARWLGARDPQSFIDGFGHSHCLWCPKDQKITDFLDHVRHFGSAADVKLSFVDTATGQTRHFSASAWLVSYGAERPRSIEGCLVDITERVRLAASMRHAVYHDAVTELPNSTHFRAHLAEVLDRFEDSDAAVKLLVIDVSDVRRACGLYGNEIGDRAIGAIADRLKGFVSKDHFLARIRSEQFALVVVSDAVNVDIDALAVTILSRLSLPLSVEGTEIEFASFVGIATSTFLQRPSIEEVTLRADIALLRAVQRGANGYAYYDESMHHNLKRQRTIETALRKPLDSQGISCVYQPQIDLVATRVVGYEALARWKHPTLGLVSPMEFIPVAERAGLIVPLGFELFDQSCQILEDIPDDIRLAINVSALQLRASNFLDRIEEILAKRNQKPSRLELELTEGLLIEASSDTLMLLDHLRGMGFSIAIDDFGTGYSSLAYLSKFPFDKIKIDRSFVAAIDDAIPARVLQSIIGLGNAIGKTVIVEGVETLQQVEWLVREGGRIVQGFLFGRPMDRARLIEDQLGKSALNRIGFAGGN